MSRLLLARAPFLRWSNPDRPLIGLNCMQPFGWGATSSGSYVASPYTNGGNDSTVMPDARIAKIKSTGFDFVRLAVDPGTLLAADSASNVTTTVLDGLIAQIVTGIGRRTDFGLRVILDMHFAADNPPVPAWNWVEVLDGGTKYTRLKFVTARIAAAIHANCKTSKVCLEIFNEPPPLWSGITTATWITHLRGLFADVRAAMPLHTIVVGGNNFNSIDSTPAGSTSGLTSLTASHFDANTGFAIHRYESPVFTHQGVDGVIYQYMHNLEFPAASHPGGQSAAESAFTAATISEGNHDGITASSALADVVTNTGYYSSLHQYFHTYSTKAQLKTYQDVATGWATSNGLTSKHIFNTEFGVRFGGSDDASEASAAAWVSAIRDNAFDSNINCVTIHEMQGSNFGIQDTSTPWSFNGAIEAALFP